MRMTQRDNYPDELLELLAERFKLLAEPVRLRLLTVLRDGERTVTALVAATGAGQANVSRHLALLHRHGMVARRRDGLHVHYRISDPVIFQLCEIMCDSVESGLLERLRSTATA
jgi:DNA-binding transcriptional ArsR family regulator